MYRTWCPLSIPLQRGEGRRKGRSVAVIAASSTKAITLSCLAGERKSEPEHRLAKVERGGRLF